MILEKIATPTGHILITQGVHGRLECLSVGDYGKEANLKADFLGLSRTPENVFHQKTMPLTKKWVITISTQYGCSMGCSFCDVPRVGPGKNASIDDMISQVSFCMSLHPEVVSTERLNVHFARMGEPTWNPGVLFVADWLFRNYNSKYNVHPVVSTMMPKNNPWLFAFIHGWMHIKNSLYNGNAGLQISVNSTSEKERAEMFHGNACDLEEVSAILRNAVPAGRKITLNFAIADYEIDPEKLLRHFHPDRYLVKLTPMHKTANATQSGLETSGDSTSYEPYQQHEKALRGAGYDVIVFLASKEEDESRITCGNAVLTNNQQGDGTVA